MGDGLMRAMLHAQLGRAVTRDQGTRLTPDQTRWVYGLLMKLGRAATSDFKPEHQTTEGGVGHE